MIWHSEPLDRVAGELKTDLETGLSGGEAAALLRENGPNKLDEKPPRSFIRRFFDQLKDAMVIILIIAAAVSLGLSVYHAIDNIRNVIAPAIIGMDVQDQTAIDETMIALDGTRYKT